MQNITLLFVACFSFISATFVAENGIHKGHHHHGKGHHHHHHHQHGRHHKNGTLTNASAAGEALKKNSKVLVSLGVSKANGTRNPQDVENHIFEKMKKLEVALSSKAKNAPQTSQVPLSKGQLFVNGPLPADFSERFAQGVAAAAAVKPAIVKVIEAVPMPQEGANIVEIIFLAPSPVVDAVENQAADPNSKLVTGTLHMFLVAKNGRHGEDPPEAAPCVEAPVNETVSESEVSVADTGTQVAETGIDVDTQMPYGDLEPFGREDTAQELTEQSVQQSDEMVDQLERAEVAEEKRAVFRALTRLRGAAITSFDGVARSQTGNIDEYNKVHKWRNTHPLHHLADEESDISKWAFPDNADF